MINRLVKVCGLTDAQNLGEVIALGPDLIGFIFYSASPRYLARPEALAFVNNLTIKPVTVGVFVNPSLDEINEINLTLRLDAVQLHGSEPAGFCQEVKREGFAVIKAFGVGPGFDFRVTDQYAECADYYLFDTASPMKGGTGEQFDWRLLEGYKGVRPFLLSGGVDPDTVEFPVHERFAGVDLNSRFETAPGMKSISLLKQFINQYRNDNNPIYPG